MQVLSSLVKVLADQEKVKSSAPHEPRALNLAALRSCKLELLSLYPSLPLVDIDIYINPKPFTYIYI